MAHEIAQRPNSADRGADAPAAEHLTAGERNERRYDRPQVLSHSGEEILRELGPAQACYPFQSCGISV